MGRSALPWAAVAALLLASAPSAHDGPPYPILVDEPVAGSVVSIWADPDVGVGTFYLYVVAAEGREPSLPDVDIAVRPVDGHAGEQVFGAVVADEDEPFQLVGETDFDRRGDWEVRFLFEDGGERAELAKTVDVTPPGLGKIDLLWYLSPFLALGFLWVKVFLARRALAKGETT